VALLAAATWLAWASCLVAVLAGLLATVLAGLLVAVVAVWPAVLAWVAGRGHGWPGLAGRDHGWLAAMYSYITA